MSRRLAQGYDAEDSPLSAATVPVVVAVGANLGDREATVREAIAEMARLPLTELVAAAAPRESVALTLDGPDESAPAYLNTVALLRTRLAPTVLLDYLHAIEARHGRTRATGAPRWQSRTLDLDLIVYGDLQTDSATLTVPHPRAAERDFVLAPWLDVDPDAMLPGRGSVRDLLASIGGDDR
jgi:2-amino-4-hydroxy-6-hydroxymethyldihydropteridine diphosphokinase